MPTWREDTIQALKNLGGVAHLSEIHKEVEKLRKGKLAREISQTIKPSNIDEYIKIRTEVAEASPSTLRIVQQEDPDMKQGIGALYKST